MGFQPGHRLSHGRPAGAVNKRSRQAEELMLKNNFNPVQAMMEIFQIALTRFAEELQREESGRISPMESSAVKYLKIASDNAANLASYVYPKLKSIEQIKHDVSIEMSPLERLEKMKTAVKLLETQLDKADEPGTN